jgi:mannose-6-phosphate isomerase-like protein (cupin superfamily)
MADIVETTHEATVRPLSAGPDTMAHVTMAHFTGRYAEKVFDWDAFPASRGYPELSRAQIRYVGAGGSPKIDDVRTLPPDHFTLSIVHQPAGKYGASHAHEVEESFTVLEGVLTVGWEWDGEVILARLGPKDMILHATNRPHGFRNEGVDPVQVSIMVGKGRPLPPHYLFHPRSDDPQQCWNFGAKPGHVEDLRWDSPDPRHRQMAAHIIRHAERVPEWQPAGFARMTYIGAGAAPAGTYRNDLIHLPKGAGVQLYERDVEDTYFVVEGCITAIWEVNGKRTETRLGPKDLIWNPPGRLRGFRNDGVTDAQFFMVVGTAQPETVEFQAI